MKTVFLSVIIGCASVALTLPAAQEPATGARSQVSVEQRFKKWDQNGDGKLDRNELPGALFDRLDVNQDGFVTQEEAKALFATRPRSGESK